MEEKVAGRFAPSPSGRLHLGNLFCSLLAWLSAKSRGGRVVLRIEDLDPARTSRAFADQLERDLEFLGLFWDEGGSGGGPHAPYYQSERAPLYEQCLAALEARGLVYPCFCSRAQLHAAEAPHAADGEPIYTGRCRALSPEEVRRRARTRSPALRLEVPPEAVSLTDGHYGFFSQNLARDCGDFILRRSDGVFAYQLAVVADDAAMGVTEVVRGRDLLACRRARFISTGCWARRRRLSATRRCCWRRTAVACPKGTPIWGWTPCGRGDFPPRISPAAWPLPPACWTAPSPPPLRSCCPFSWDKVPTQDIPLPAGLFD